MIKRELYDILLKHFFKGKLLVIFGARQTGKTTLIKELQKKYQRDSIYLNCDQPNVAEQLRNRSSQELNLVIKDKKVVFIDEAQRVENIGLTLKLLIDNFPEKQIVATGSSSFDLANKINEPLTGRKFEYQLFPISLKEVLQKHDSMLDLSAMIEQRIIYGMYPDVVENMPDARQILENLTSSYLYKDIFEWQQIRKPDLIVKLLKAIALQTGNEVSYHELASLLGVAKETVISYINLLEQTFVIFRLGAFSRNLRTELKKKQKIYFWDTGVRNALINNFNPLTERQDTGAIWENFMISERMKSNEYNRHYCNSYFWRTTTQQEIDYIEEYEGQLHAYEFKWSSKKKAKIPASFKNTYDDSIFKVIGKGNFMEFVRLL
ncbi:MAG: ATP-binding protein [Bacteroidales bacterium]|nr:ATP-binding protein [Bacteroidales bacterium]MCF8386231.1 ATP-binding protein [Bacteroidales bacterium]MCF8397484.1 ATP-binding protein [Bacteroidales bacterium]